jgi:hypothetical protein
MLLCYASAKCYSNSFEESYMTDASAVLSYDKGIATQTTQLERKHYS